MLRRHYDTVEHSEAGGLHWFHISPLITPGHWSPDAIPVVFFVTAGHPGAPPYGFFVPANLKFQNKPPSETGAKHQPPFPGSWRFLSWKAEGWSPAADIAGGSNLWGWVRSFRHRLEEGQ